MNPYHLLYLKYRVLLLALFLLIFASAAGLARAANLAQEEPACGVNGVTCPVVVEFNPIILDGEPPAGSWTIGSPGAPSFGALVYADFKKMEEEARVKLRNGLTVRQALSPYQGNIEFQDYVMKFDTAAGWDANYVSNSDLYTETMTLLEAINRADQDLRDARDLYGYLAVFAPVDTFREDAAYITTTITATLTGDSAPLCGRVSKEDPNPVDPAHSGQVLDPIIDWCDFPARLRQAVREAANLRLIFGQQFMVDATGLHFSGTEFYGGEEAVRKEMVQMDAARQQYEQAELGLTESLDRAIGNGCYISDYYTEAEWSLLSRAIENQETAQHHIAMRSSYLDISSPDKVTQVRGQAVQDYRKAAMNGYLKLIAMAGMAAQPGSGCSENGEPLDGGLVGNLALSLQETRRKASELGAGRNVFGYDVTFTPARPYKSSVPMTCDTTSEANRGLWDEAYCAAQYAKELQNDEMANTRIFDEQQAELLQEVERIRNVVDEDVGERTHCYRDDFADDAAWYACVDEQIEALAACQVYANQVEYTVNAFGRKEIVLPSKFDTCINQKVNGKVLIRPGSAKQALLDLRSVYMDYQRIKLQAEQIDARVKLSNDRNATVRDSMFASGTAETAARVSSAALDLVSCLDPNVNLSLEGIQSAIKNVGCGVAGGINIDAQLTAGNASMHADIAMEDAENTKEIRNLLLDQSELVIDAYSANQQYASKEAEFTRTMGDTASSLQEAQRARKYFQSSPANDPSFRMVRDSSRMVLAKQMDYAARLAYLAARRAEYEYAARLSASNFRISDIYRARTADDILRYLAKLQGVTNNLAGSASYQVNAKDLTISVAQHVLLLTDEALAEEGFSTPEQIEAERTRRFRAWVKQNTIATTNILSFNLTTAPQDGGTLSSIISTGYERYWLIKLSGIDMPKTSSNGVALNLVTDQSGLSYRSVALTQGGLVNLRSFAGCTFDYRLISPAALLGLEWPASQLPEAATAVWNGNVNGAHSYTENGYRASDFFGRAASGTEWQVVVYGNAPAVGLPKMDLQQLSDIELIFSVTYASRSPGTPSINDCIRVDW